MRQYELVVIVRPETGEERVSAAMERIQQYVTARGGEVNSIDHWGRRKLAYPIEKALEGDYVLARLSLKPQDTRDLESSLLIAEDVLRHLLVRVED